MSSTCFSNRHIGPGPAEQQDMLAYLGLECMDELLAETIPADLRLARDLNIPEGISEEDALAEMRAKATQNTLAKSMLGQGYYGTHTPPVILRNMFENPGWYTAYTPYQPEISQGRLEMLFNFQTLVSELTGLPFANASLLDEATAVAEAASMAIRKFRHKRKSVIFGNVPFKQSEAVLNTRAESMGFSISHNVADLSQDTAALILQCPDRYGVIDDHSALIEQAKELGVLVIIATDPLALLMMDTPGNLGADISIGSLQRYGVPMGNGGPHAAYIAVTDDLVRLMPGRLVGASVDRYGDQAFRLALQTREQHIRREKATSNICTAQALLANMAAAYAIWHGAEGLEAIARQTHQLTVSLAKALQEDGYEIKGQKYFDTITLIANNQAHEMAEKAKKAGYLICVHDENLLSISCDETTSVQDINSLLAAFGISTEITLSAPILSSRPLDHFLRQEVFLKTKNETSMMRYLRLLKDKDLALDQAMIPLGSCTMKLNAAASMMPVSWPEIGQVHPFSPAEMRLGYQSIIDDLDQWLSEVGGFAKTSLQPNAGSQGEYAGLLAIKAYHVSRGDEGRNIVLIPTSAHGTNPASAQMAGLNVVLVKCNDQGEIDLDDLSSKAAQYQNQLAAAMMTYPSTHGVFETTIRDICSLIHEHGGQVYIDGANLNAMVGLVRLGDFGADVCHMNLHKTFSIPHGGGGPGIGPIGVAEHLIPFLPESPLSEEGFAVTGAPFGSASILPITWMYIRMLGAEGLRRASESAILSANYLAARLKDSFDILYTNQSNRVAHECIIDPRPFKETAGVSIDDIAKRLIDYGFHAPTMSWPVMGTLMIEPTESEPLSELDRFADAMIAIRKEIEWIEAGQWTMEDNPIVNAPHTAASLTQEEWPHQYSRAIAVFPANMDRMNKYWPPVARVDNAHGDRNLVCSCPPLEHYAEAV